MKVPNLFIPGNRSLDKKIKELSDEPKKKLESDLQEDIKNIEITIERPEHIIKEEQGNEWIQKILNYAQEIAPDKFEIEPENWRYHWVEDRPPEVIFYKKVMETVQKRRKYMPFIKVTRQEKKLYKAITVMMPQYVRCHDRDYEAVAIELAKKLGSKKISVDY